VGKKILLSVGFKEKRVAVLEEDKLVELRSERFLDKDAAFGNIYKGKVVNVLPGMDAAFVNIGTEKNAFIHACDLKQESCEKQKIQKLVHPGENLMVQIKKEATGTKGARVTSQLTVPGHYLVLMPSGKGIGISRRIEDENERDRLKLLADKIKPAKMGLIIRTAANGVTPEELINDLDYLLQLWSKIEKKARREKAPALLYSDSDLTYRLVRNLLVEDLDKIIVDSQKEGEKLREALQEINPKAVSKVSFYSDKEPLFQAYGIEHEIEKSLRRKIWLDCGGFLIFDQTEALLIIDVNTGKFTGKDSLQSTVLRTNLDAAQEIARQLRLRNTGGIIIIDFIDMEDPKDKEQVRQRLEECLKKDRVRTNILGFTSLGLLELTRQKSSHDLSSIMQKTCPECGGLGKIYDEETLALRLIRDLKSTAINSTASSFRVKAHPLVIAKLKEMAGEDLSDIKEELKRDLILGKQPDKKLWEYDIFEE